MKQTIPAWLSFLAENTGYGDFGVFKKHVHDTGEFSRPVCGLPLSQI